MVHRLTPFQVAILLMLCAFVTPASAGDNKTDYDRINLSVSATDEIENDTLVVQLYAQKEGQIASQLAKQINQDIEWAVQHAKQIAGIEVQTLDYQTSPTYHKQSQDGWRVRQSLRLTSQDTLAISQLIGELQQRLMIENIRYKISQKRRNEAESRLTTQVINAFKARAKLISSAWGRASYRLVQMEINTSGRIIQPMYRQEAVMASADALSPTLETGKQTVQVVASGTIELQKE